VLPQLGRAIAACGKAGARNRRRRLMVIAMMSTSDLHPVNGANPRAESEGYCVPGVQMPLPVQACRGPMLMPQKEPGS